MKGNGSFAGGLAFGIGGMVLSMLIFGAGFVCGGLVIAAVDERKERKLNVVK